MSLERSRVPGVAIAGPTLAVRFDGRGQTIAWGSSAAVLGGALAAGADFTLPATWLRLVAGWFCAVPLLASLWTTLPRTSRMALSSHARTAVEPREAAVQRRAGGVAAARRLSSRAWGAVGMAMSVSLIADVEWLNLLAAGGLGLLVAFLLGGDVGAHMVLIMLTLAWVRRQWQSPSAVTLGRSLCGFLAPSTLVWLALGGDRSVPVAQAVLSGWPWELAMWLMANRLPLLILVALTLAHTAATRSTIGGGHAGRWLLAGAYVLAIAVLVTSERVLAAGGVALLLVLQWPWLTAWPTVESADWPVVARRAWFVATVVTTLTAGFG